MSGRIDTLDAFSYDAILKLARSADSLLAGLMDEVTVEAENGATVVFGHTVSDMQSDVAIVGYTIEGILQYVADGALPTTWGAGYFLTLKFSDPDATATTVKVGLDPSVSSGLVALDEDMNAVFKVTNKSTQRLKIVSTDGTRSTVQYFDLSKLILAPQD